MRRIAALAMIVLLSACGSDNGPRDTFSGSWAGDAIVSGADTIHFDLTSTQSGSTITGSGTVLEGSTTEPVSFTGTSTPPSLSMVFTVGTSVINYDAMYVRSDSVTGTLTDGSDTSPLSLGKQ
jgi:type 1 fimbria pilin